jgi:iron complex transport system ATP-binding protein
MHDLNLAALYFDDIVLLEGGRIVAQGSPPDVLNADRIRSVFHANVLIQPHPARPLSPHVILLPEQDPRSA